MFLRNVSLVTLECIVTLIYLRSVQTSINLHDVKNLAKDLGIKLIQTHTHDAANTRKKSQKRRRSSADIIEVTQHFLDNVQPVVVKYQENPHIVIEGEGYFVPT